MEAEKDVVDDPDNKLKLYKRRWFMLSLYIMLGFNGAQQSAQFTIINNLVRKYYNNVSATEVEWTANVFTLAYIILAIPALYLMDILGVRYTLVLGALGITVGNWIKVCSVVPDRFYLAFIGQCCAASFMMLTYGLTGRFTALFFGANEISTASVLALIGDQLGIASAFFFPSVFVKDGTKEEIGNGIRTMHLTIAIISTTILALIWFFFESKPKRLPSVSQVKQKQMKEETIFKYLFMFSSLVIRKVLDKTRLFKENAIFLTIGSAITIGAFTWSLKSNNIQNVYIVALFIGFFVLGFYATGFQMGIEVTYPVSEGISSAVMLLSVQLHGCIITIIYSYAIKLYGDLPSNIGLTIMFAMSALFSILIPSNLKRQHVEKTIHEEVHEERKEFL